MKPLYVRNANDCPDCFTRIGWARADWLTNFLGRAPVEKKLAGNCLGAVKGLA